MVRSVATPRVSNHEAAECTTQPENGMAPGTGLNCQRRQGCPAQFATLHCNARFCLIAVGICMRMH